MTLKESLARNDAFVNRMTEAATMAQRAISALPNMEIMASQYNLAKQMASFMQTDTYQMLQNVYNSQQFSALQESLNYINKVNIGMLNPNISLSTNVFLNDSLLAVCNQVSALTTEYRQSALNIGELLGAKYTTDIYDKIKTLPIFSPETIASMNDVIGMYRIPGLKLNENDTLCVDGVDFSQEDLTREFCEQVQSLQNVQQPKLDLKQTLDFLKEKYWLVFLIFSLLWTIPDIPDKANFYLDAIGSIQSIVSQENPSCYTIREKSYLREKADAKSPVITTLVYDEKLEIIDTIPRWYQVKYLDENGEEIVGWISKISVEEEE